MKKTLLACLLIALMFVMNCFALAGNVETDIAGHTYTVNLGGTVYEIRYEPKYQLDCCLIGNRRSRHAILDHVLRRFDLVSDHCPSQCIVS